MQIYFESRIDHYKKIFPNVSFPVSGPSDAFLADKGAVKVSVFREHNRATQKLVPSDPVVEGGFCYVVSVVDKTAEEIAADVESKASQMRAARDQALQQSDWRAIRAAETGVAMDAEWAAYRQALRDLPESADWPNVSIPNDPDFVPLGD